MKLQISQIQLYCKETLSTPKQHIGYFKSTWIISAYKSDFQLHIKEKLAIILVVTSDF